MPNCNENGCKSCNEGGYENLMECLCIHAEENCILELGTMASIDSTCYTTDFPCIWCTKVLLHGVNSNIF